MSMERWRDLEKINSANVNKVRWWATNEMTGEYIALDDLKIIGYLENPDNPDREYLLGMGGAGVACAFGDNQCLELDVDFDKALQIKTREVILKSR